LTANLSSIRIRGIEWTASTHPVVRRGLLPGNITRFMGLGARIVYARRRRDVGESFVNSTAEVKLDNGRVFGIAQKPSIRGTAAIRMTVSPDKSAPATITCASPDGPTTKAISSDLYKFVDARAHSRPCR